MSRKFFLALLCAVMLSAVPFFPVRAQVSVDDSLAIEVMMLHEKMLERTPDYMTIILANPEFALAAKRDGFGQSALINQQRILLERLYNESGPNKPLYATKRMIPSSINEHGRIILFDRIEPDDPFLFRVTPDNAYAIFVRNGEVLSRLRPPYEFDDFVSLKRTSHAQKGRFSVQFTLKPVAADDRPFALSAQESVKVLLAEITEIRIEEDGSRKLLLYKKLNDDGGLPLPVPQQRSFEPANDFVPSAPPR